MEATARPSPAGKALWLALLVSGGLLTLLGVLDLLGVGAVAPLDG